MIGSRLKELLRVGQYIKNRILSKSMGQPNIIWLTLDSVRADHTSLHDYDTNTTPFLSKLAGDPDSYVFDQCFSHGMSTRTATASILTGTYPSHHQTWTNTERSAVKALPDELKTVPEVLNNEGYQTIGISPNIHFSPATDLDRGFSEFTYLTPKRILSELPIRSLLKFGWNIRKHSAGLTHDLQKHSRAYLIKEAIRNQVNSADSEKPLFLYGHFNEPHTAWHPPLPYIDEYLNRTELPRDEAIEFAMRVHREDIPSGDCVQYTDAEWDALTALYDAEIKYNDRIVGEVYRYVQEQLGEDLIFVVTGDHGDLFGEYDLVGHMHCLHDGLIHVPMVVQGIQEDLSTDNLVQHMDIMQTILDHVGADTSQWQGYNLHTEKRDIAVSQRSPETEETMFSSEMLTSARTKNHKLIHASDETRLYRLPNETEDIGESDTKVMNELRSFVEKLLEDVGQPVTESKDRKMTKEMENQLRNLGYIQ